ncbi:hypothetical protein L7F22_062782 [Adiantum nelumboides]|nr:hypothetical protein [Adiantum nelumboides]
MLWDFGPHTACEVISDTLGPRKVGQDVHNVLVEMTQRREQERSQDPAAKPLPPLPLPSAGVLRMSLMQLRQLRRAQLDNIASANGMDPKNYRTINLLVEALKAQVIDIADQKQQGEESLLDQSQVYYEIWGDSTVECEDCHDGEQADVLVLTRSKGKKTIDWKEKKDIRDKVQKRVLKVQKDEMLDGTIEDSSADKCGKSHESRS